MEVEEDFSLEYLFQCRNFSLWQRLIYSVSCHVHLLQGNATLSGFTSASLFQEKGRVSLKYFSCVLVISRGHQLHVLQLLIVHEYYVNINTLLRKNNRVVKLGLTSVQVKMISPLCWPHPLQSINDVMQLTVSIHKSNIP